MDDREEQHPTTNAVMLGKIPAFERQLGGVVVY